MEEFRTLERVNPGGYHPVSKFVPGILVKSGWDYDAEVRAFSSSMDGFLFTDHAFCITPPSQTPSSSHGTGRRGSGAPSWGNAEARPSTPLLTACPPSDSIASLINSSLFSTRRPRARYRRSHNNRSFPWRPPHAFPNTKEYLDYYRGIFLEFCEPDYVEELLSYFPTDAQVLSTHGDPLPHNIPADGSKVTTIIDWETADYYPEF